MDISNANTFKVKLYFEACWDAARANKLAEFTGAATYDETEKKKEGERVHQMFRMVGSITLNKGVI